MRHLRSVLYALVLGPTVWTMCAVGLTPGHTGRARGDDVTVEAVGGLALLVLAGAAYALLLLPQFAPTGPLLAGLAFLGLTAWALLDPASYDAAWPAAVTRDGFDLRLPGRALAAFLAVPLLATAFSRRRWRRRDEGLLVTTAPRPTAPYPGLAAEETQVLSTGGPAGTTQALAATVAAEATQSLPSGRQAAGAEATQSLPSGRQAAGAEATQALTAASGPAAPSPSPTGGTSEADAETTRRIAVPAPPGEATVRLPSRPTPGLRLPEPPVMPGEQAETAKLTATPTAAPAEKNDDGETTRILSPVVGSTAEPTKDEPERDDATPAATAEPTGKAEPDDATPAADAEPTREAQPAPPDEEQTRRL